MALRGVWVEYRTYVCMYLPSLAFQHPRDKINGRKGKLLTESYLDSRPTTQPNSTSRATVDLHA